MIPITAKAGETLWTASIDGAGKVTWTSRVVAEDTTDWRPDNNAAELQSLRQN